MFPQILLTLSFLWFTQAQNGDQYRASIDAMSNIYACLTDLNQTDNFFSLDDFLDVVATDRGHILSPNCAEDMAVLASARLGQFEYPEFAKQVWLPIRDSAGKFGPAILKGHVYFAGHFSECVQIEVQLTGRERPFKADYFKVSVDIMFQSNSKNGSCIETGGVTIAWSFGLCLPASCSSAEVQDFFRSNSVKPNPVCRIQRTNDSIDELGAGFYVTISIMGIILALCLLSGIADFFFADYLNDKPASKKIIKQKSAFSGIYWRIFMCFSLYSNVASIFDTTGSKKPGQIAPINCIRFFSMCWMVTGHLTSTYMGVTANPFDIIKLSDDITSEVLFNFYFCVDSFFFVGGLLLTFIWFKAFDRNPKQAKSPRSWVMFYVHRILRISPPYYMILLFFTYAFKQMYRNSPVNMNFIAQQDNCKASWWRELTYLQNFIGNDCLGYDWYLATDMQMFFFSPFLIIPLAFKPVVGFIVAAVFFVVSSGLNIFFIGYYHWPATIPFIGPSDPEMANYDKYMEYIYSSPIIRCQVYIMGMLVGWLLHTKKRMRINPIINIVLWMISFALMITVVLGLHSQTTLTGNVIPVFWRAMYSAFSKPAWALGLSWIIISCYYGYGGPINAFMSWHIWVPLGRLSYCGYLLHDPILLLILVQSHDEVYFSSFTDYTITRIIPIIALIYFVCIFWSACFEISFGRMEMLLLGGHRQNVKSNGQALSDRKRAKSQMEEGVTIRM